MYLINIQAKPTKETDYYDTVAGAFASVYVDYKDLKGAVNLAKLYVTQEGWEVVKVDDEYFTLNSLEDVEQEEDQIELYNEALEYGYSIILNCYEEEEEDDSKIE